MGYDRYFHNLVMLPNGRVLAVGGMSGYQSDGNWNPANARNTPEWWDPDSGAWSSLSPHSDVIRNYHSTAVLLPDGRVLTGGGWWYDPVTKTNPNANMKRLQVFCPPYLFNSSGNLAQRPVIASAPDTVSWRQTFSVCVSDPATVTSASLIRPGATTHGFDMSQRFVPLVINARTGTGAAGDPKRLYLTAPASPDSAPAGDYLLFVVGSSERTDVPSIAKWVYVRGDGVDWCDVIPPGTITDLAPDIVGPSEIWFTWTATADDGVIAASGPERSFDLRGTTAPLNASNWASAIQSTDESVPGVFGTWGSGHIGGLQECTSYYFCVRARDDHSQDGGYHSASFQTACGGGGGGYSALQLRPDDEGVVAASAQATANTAGLLVVTTRPEADGVWRIGMRLQPSPTGSEPAATITLDPDGGGGASDTLARFEPDSSDNLLGLCALRDRGRLGIPGVYSIEQVVPHLHSRAGDLVLRAGTHSRLGPLSEAFVASGGPLEFAIGDSLNLSYAPAGRPLADAGSWYALVRRTGKVPPPMSARRGPLGETLAARFALHQNRPNPFRGTTVIPFDLASEAQVSLAVFDVLGRRVATLVDRPMPAGSHTAEWDMRNTFGSRVPPGVYTYRISAGPFHERRKLTVLP